MKKINFFINYKYNLIVLLVLIFFSTLSLYIYQFIYDGHHHGLMFSNAIDLLNAKKPYEEIFIQYGFLTTIIHSIGLFFLGKELYTLHIITIIFYFLSVYFIYLIIKELINSKIAIISILILLFNHPVPWLPWSNYISYFFIILSIFSFIKKTNYNYLLTGLFLGMAVLSRQDYFVPIFITLLLFSLIYLISSISINRYSNIIKIIFAFIAPISLFILYLYLNNLFIPWIQYLILPNLYLDLNNTSIIEYIKNFVTFFLSVAFTNFINKPQYLLIAIILITNSIFLIKFIRFKQYNLIFISLLSLSSSAVGISTELFRLYTSVSIGIIVLMCTITTIKSEDLRKFAFFFLLSTSIFSITFYPWGNNQQFKKINITKSNVSPKSILFTHNKWTPHKVRVLNEISYLKELILDNCSIQYAENLTFDNYFANSINLNRVRLLPYVKSNAKNQSIDTLFNKNFVQRINELISKENIIILIAEDNYSYDSGSIIFSKEYTYKKIKLNDINQKPNILKFYYPTKCYSKF